MTSTDARQWKIDRKTASFVDAELEKRFLAERSADALAFVRIGSAIVAIVAVLFIAIDRSVMGPEFDSTALHVIRGAIFVFAAIVFFYASPKRDFESVESLTTAFAACVIVSFPAIQHLRPTTLPTTLPILVFLTLGLYLFFPGSYRKVCLLGLFTGVALVGEVLSRSPTNEVEVMLTFTVALIANVFGMATIYRIRVSERRQFGARLAQEESLTKLNDTARAQAMFVAMLSHDLRNYLNGIVGTSQIMLGADDDSLWRRQARTVAELSRNLVRLLDDALDMLRARHAEIKVETTELDLGRAIANVAGPLRARAEAKGLRFDVKVSPRIPETLDGDEFRVVQIVGNLISNAIQFTPRGQIGFEVAPVGDEEPTTRIRFVVADTGPALSSEEIAGLFKPDAHLDGGTRNARAAGLGLYICKVLVDRLGGTIAVTSDGAAGNRFVVELSFQAQPAASRTAARTAFSDDLSARALTVLSVDDSPVNLEIIEASLRRLGHIVVSARDGESALRVARAQAFDVALVDLRMPGMSGEQLAQALRNDCAVRAHGAVPLIVAVTAETFVDLSPGQAPAGFDGLLPKPIDLVELSRYLGLARGRSAGSGDKDHTRSAIAIDWERLAELKRDLDRGGLDRVMTTGRTFVEQSLARLERALADAKTDDILAIAHALKGAAANIGLASVARAAVDIEIMTRRGDLDGARPLVAELRSEAPSVLSAVDAWMGRPAQQGRP